MVWKTHFGWVVVAALLVIPAHSATQTVDLDGRTGQESQCDLNIVTPYPAEVENKVTNRAIGDTFTFRWRSAGPGSFDSSLAAGTSPGGVGAVWRWTTLDAIYSYTGLTCEKDICFNITGGPDVSPSYCSSSCLVDATTVSVTRGTNPSVTLTWSAGTAPFTVYRSSNKASVRDSINVIGTTNNFFFTDPAAPATGAAFYVVRGTDCLTRKSCTSDAGCSQPGDGTCVSRGPFFVPGRSTLETDITVSAASLETSFLSFFSPLKELFKATSTGASGAVRESFTSGSPLPIFVITPGHPPGCCPANPEVPHQIRCGETCVDYLNDPQNCGACGNVCEDGSCCSGGVCASICDAGESYCGGGNCADLQNDNNNCGSCGEPCGDGTCCSEGGCASLCGDGRTWCDGACADFQSDSDNCGGCGIACGATECCSAGACVAACDPGQTLCDGQCVDAQSDPDHCGACGNACGDGACCTDGTCVVACPEGQVLCGEQCVDLANDSDNCGACGNACGAGGCCSAGSCASVCEPGRTLCGDLCYDTQNDPNNCGGCGIQCDGQSVCSAGSCQPCTGSGGRRDACDNRCVNLRTDPYNCGACGNSCQLNCPSNFHGVCSNGTSCSCEAGAPPPPPPSGIPEPTEPFCPNPHPTHPTNSQCSEATPPTPTNPHCPVPTVGPVPGVCPNPDLTHGPVPGVCPVSVSDPPPADEAPTCVLDPTTTTIPPGGTVTTCRPGGVLFKEVQTEIVVCGDGIPGVDGICNSAATKITTGSYNRLVADTSQTVGNAYLTPYRVQIVSDSTNDGMLAIDESGSFVVSLLNAGPVSVTGATATVSSPLVDLTDDGVSNPVGITLPTSSFDFGLIQGMPTLGTCDAPAALFPASNAVPIQVTIPANHTPDTSRVIVLHVTGEVAGEHFEQDVPFTMGIADRCVAEALTRDFDGVNGLSSPMAKLVPVGDTVQFPSKAFTAGNSRPMKLQVLCGGVNLTDEFVDAPEIIALSEATRGPLDIHALNLNDDGNNPNDPFFRFSNAMDALLQGGHWSYTMRTSLLGTGRFTLTIRIGGRKEYVTGFELE